ncbi:MAG: AAA family ATPase, partial [Flavobacteriales bacterium]|nr:AAA family ATPase [Flavobacteriales bacterium]
MTYKSEVRDSVKQALADKVATQNYGKYLRRLSLKKVRGFSDQPVAFDFPVTAIVGPNGGGKTTILGAAGILYKSVGPQQFFAKSGAFDETMKDWSIEYEAIDRSVSTKETIRRSANFLNFRWRRDALQREVLVFGVSRTVPAGERVEMRKFAKTAFSVPPEHVVELSEAVRDAVQRILGKNMDGFKLIRINDQGRVTMLSGRTPAGTSYSEFHFGAGESSVIRMVIQIEAAEEQALVLIEEIENGLHPLATVRMVEYLLGVAQRKKLQAIFTTHSNEALLPLPTNAIWVATQDRVFQGKLDIHSLRAITGQIEASLVIFVEDQFAKHWVQSALRTAENVAVDHIQVHGMEGDGTAVKIHLAHNLNPSVSTKSVCLIDGDSKQQENHADLVFRLPGDMPERYLYDRVMDAWDRVGGRLCVALLQPFERSEQVKNQIQDVRMSNSDAHVLYSQIGERLG